VTRAAWVQTDAPARWGRTDQLGDLVEPLRALAAAAEGLAREIEGAAVDPRRALEIGVAIGRVAARISETAERLPDLVSAPHEHANALDEHGRSR
jgi:hypothetical protein